MTGCLKILFPSLLLLLSGLAFTQTPREEYLSHPVEQHPFDSARWETLTAGIDYGASTRKKKDTKAPPPERRNSGLANFIKYLAIVLGIALLVFLFLKMATGEDFLRPRNRKLQNPVTGIDFGNIDNDLPRADLDEPIRQAVASGQYVLAIRLHYLAILKELSLKKHIKWKQDKTNGDYLRELAGSPLFSPVQKATLIFERVWYGTSPLDKEEYFALEPTFRRVQESI